jgi:isoleucyl-tRNA synthetase
MSKRLGNAVDPFSTIQQHGSDPLRWYMITNASPWDNLKFDMEGVEEVKRKFFGTLYNTYAFFALYANVDGFTNQEPEIPLEQRPEIDRWILSLLNSLVSQVNNYYNTYEPTRAGRAIAEFVNDHLSNWYVRLNRKRFWGGQYDADKISAYQTLYQALETVARLMAPIAPFYADRLYLDLVSVTGKGNPVSVHLESFPELNPAWIDQSLEERMEMAQTISSMVLALRKKVNIKVRQPLSVILLPIRDTHLREQIESVQSLILNETNVKEIRFVDNTSSILIKKIKPDFKQLGPRFGKIMKLLSNALASMSQDEIALFEQNGSYVFNVDGQEAVVTLSDVEIISEDIPGWLVANNGKLTVALDISLTDALLQEGMARELVNRIQNLRKTKGFEITDRIEIRIQYNEAIEKTINTFADYIKGQTLANQITLVPTLSEADVLEIDEDKVVVEIKKA